MCTLTSEHIFLIVPFNCRFCNDIFVFAKSITSPSSPNISYFLPNPSQKLLQQIHPTNHKLLHKLIRLFQLILQASVFLPEHLILIPQLYHLLLQIIVAINSSQSSFLSLSASSSFICACSVCHFAVSDIIIHLSASF